MVPRTPSTRGPSWRRRMVASAAVAIMVAAGVVVGAQPAMAAGIPGISLGADVVVGEADGHVDVQVKLSAAGRFGGVGGL